MYEEPASAERKVAKGAHARWPTGLPWAAALLTAAVRAAVLLAAADFSGRDADAYRQLAGELAATGRYTLGGEPTALRPPVYPGLLAAVLALGFHSDAAIGVLHVLLGAATAGLTCAAAGRFGLGCGPAALAGLLVAVDPILLNQSRLVMSETAAACCAAACLWALSRWQSAGGVRRAAIAGLSLGVAALCRPEFFPLLPLAPLTAVRRLGLRPALLAVFVAAMPVAAWTVRNWIELGRPIALTTHGGYTLLLANNDHFFDYLHRDNQNRETPPSGKRRQPWDSAGFDAELARQLTPDGTTHAAGDDQYYRQAWETIRRRPGDFAHACVYRATRFWSVLPYARELEESGRQRTLRGAIAFWYAALFAACAVGLWNLGVRAISPPWVWAIWLILCFALIHLFYWSDMRMRAGITPALALLAAAAWQRAERSRGGLAAARPTSV